MMPGQLTDPKQILAFMFAGNATVTLRSLKSGDRRTYKIRQADPDASKGETQKPDLFFVSLLTGQDNENSYNYMGIVSKGTFRTTRKSRMDGDSVPVKAFMWALEHFQKSAVPESLEVWHEGRCGRCGRKLTVPESIATGFGPECAGRIELEVVATAAKTPLDEPRAKKVAAATQYPLGLQEQAAARQDRKVIPIERNVTIQGVTLTESQAEATANALESLLDDGKDDLDNVPEL